MDKRREAIKVCECRKCFAEKSWSCRGSPPYKKAELDGEPSLRDTWKGKGTHDGSKATDFFFKKRLCKREVGLGKEESEVFLTFFVLD